jgi:predicted transcriptional regulator
MPTTQGIKLDDDTQARLKSLAEKRKRTPHWLMRSAIEDYLNREERYEAEKAEDMARWDHYLITGNALEHEKVEGWLKDLAQGKPRKWQK